MQAPHIVWNIRIAIATENQLEVCAKKNCVELDEIVRHMAKLFTNSWVFWRSRRVRIRLFLLVAGRTVLSRRSCLLKSVFKIMSNK